VASQTDNLYINILTNVKGAIEPLQKLAKTIQTVMNLGGMAMVIAKAAQAIGDMEKAYAKMYPESQNAVGSLKQWNSQMEGMKAKAGGVVSSILSPIRQAFLDMIDPIGSATYELEQLGKGLQAIADKYLTTDRKAYESRQQALDDLTKSQTAFTKAINTQGYYQEKVNATEKEYARLVALNKNTGGYGGSSLGALIAAAKKASDIAKEQYDGNEKIIIQSRTAIRNATEYLAVVDKGSDAAVKKETALKEVAVEVNRVYQERLETAQEYMEAWDQVNYLKAETLGTGTKGSSKAVSRKTIGRKGAADKADDETEAVKELTAEWQKYADLLVTISASLGEAFVTGDYVTAIRQMTTALLDFIAKEAIAAGLKQILVGNIPFGIALLALGGITMGVSAGVRASGGGGGGGEESPYRTWPPVVSSPGLRWR